MNPVEARRRSRKVVGLFSLIIVVIVVGSAAGWVLTQYNKFYVFQPGTAPEITTSATCAFDSRLDELAFPDGSPCIRIHVPAGMEHAIDGHLLMVDVLVGQATPLEYALHELHLFGTFYHDDALKPAAAVLGTAPASQLGCEDTEESVGATTTAPVAALSRLGYKVTVNRLGAQVDEVFPGTAAAAAGVECDDLIVGLNGARVRTLRELFKDIANDKPGDVVALTVERQVSGKVERLNLHLKLTGVPAIDGQPANPKVGFLGVGVQNLFTYNLPFGVTADVGNIGGPSDGLAITLAILNTLSGGKLLGGHTVAASGTISSLGNVGQVGGVAQKAVAVSRAGATLFLVPDGEGAAARSTAGSHLRVVQVANLSQAISTLESIGGSLPVAAPH